MNMKKPAQVTVENLTEFHYREHPGSAAPTLDRLSSYQLL